MFFVVVLIENVGLGVVIVIFNEVKNLDVVIVIGVNLIENYLVVVIYFK